MRGGETQIPQCEPARQADSRQADRQAGETISETGGKFLLCKRFARVCQGLSGDLSGFARIYRGLPCGIFCHVEFL